MNAALPGRARAVEPSPDATLLERLWQRRDLGTELFAFYDEDGRVAHRLTLGGVLAEADAISGFLIDGRGLRPGDRVLLAYPPGLAFVSAFLGCLTAGVVPVPIYPPSPDRLELSLDNLARVAHSSGARVVLTESGYNRFRRLSTLTRLLPGRAARWPSELAWEATDALRPGRWPARRHVPAPSDLAFLQYTSGSSSAPKGVRITWANLEHQLRYNAEALGMGPDARFVAWVPQYHDLGLISGIASILAGNGWLGLISPVSFLRRPQVWFDVVTRTRATHTAAPNFAYELLVRKTTAAQRAGWDLSTLRCALNAAEPVLPSTRRAFAEAFAPCGFRPEAWCAAYGLAEHTVGITVGGGRTLRIDRTALERDRRADPTDEGDGCEVSSCGRPGEDIVVRIVDPARGTPIAEGGVGEIWVASPSVADGYEALPEETAHTFHARVPGDGRDYLRTGDLGFLHAGELFVTGRSKDLVIIGGRNLAPQDIEGVVQGAHPAVRPGCVIAFSVPGEHGEELVVVAECRKGEIPAARLSVEVTPALCAAVTRSLGVPVRAVALLRAGTIPKTTSGKVRRQECRARWLAGDLASQALSVATFDPGAVAPPSAVARAAPEVLDGPSSPEARLVCAEVSALLGGASVNPAATFSALGLDSLGALDLSARLERALGVAVPPVALFHHPTPAALAAHLASLPPEASAADPDAPRAEAPREGPFALTEVQRAYWIGRNPELPLGGVSCHAYLELDAPSLDLGRLERAIDRLVAHHEVLRATVSPDGRWVPVAEAPPFRAPLHDLRALSGDEASEALRSVRARLESLNLPADRWPLFALEASLLPDGGGCRLHLHVDMLVLDGGSLLLAARQLLALLENPQAALPPVAGAMRRYHADRLADPLRGASEAWWREWLRTAPSAGPALPMAGPSAASCEGRFTRRAAVLSPARWEALRAACQQRGISPSAAVMTVFSEVLATWSATPDFLMTVPLFDRPQAAPEALGDFTSLMLVARQDARGSLLARARRMYEQVLRGLEHRRVDVLEVLRSTELDPAQVPVVVTSFLPLQEQLGGAGGDVPGVLVHASSATPQVGIDHQLFSLDGALHLTWDCREGLLVPGVLDAMFAAYAGALDALADDASAWDAPPAIRLPAEQLARRLAYNATGAPAPSETLDDLFRAQVARRPEAPAVLTADRSFSYAELAVRADAVARWLSCAAAPLRGGAEAPLVAVVMEKGWEEVVAALAAVRCAVAYVPVNACMPEARIRSILDGSGARLVLTQRKVLAGHPWLAGLDCAAVDEAEPAPAARPEGSRGASRPEDVAYVIYTSGSTGAPKGVVVDHRGAVNTVLDVNRRFGVGPADRALALSSMSFDLSVYDVFGLLAAGGALVVPDAALATEPSHWLALATQHGATLWNSVPALMSMWVAHLRAERERPPLRLVMLSGDWVPVSLPDEVRALHGGAEVVSLGGATEGSIWSIFHPVGEVAPGTPSIPYGRPLSNQTFHVLDEALRPRPEHVTGELYIGGSGVALGYWRAPELTAERFIRHPETGERLYRTGDLGAMDPAGHLVFQGRIDSQVKIRGFRVEPGEVESALERLDGVGRAAVVATGTAPGPRQLVGFVVPARPGEPVDLEAAVRGLRARLPPYMVPAELRLLAEMPLNRNGKVDRAQLTSLAARRPEASTGRGEAPRGATETAVAAVWCEVLGVDAVARTDDFFALGGDSLQAVEMAVALRRLELPRRVTAADVFRCPTLAALAALAGDGEGGERALDVADLRLPEGSVDGGPYESVYPTSAMQEVLLRRYGRGIYHNQLVLLTPLSVPQQGQLAAALSLLMARHAALRTVFPRGGGGVRRQAVRASLPCELIERDLRGRSRLDQDMALDAVLLEDRARPFAADGSGGALFRCWVLRVSDTHAAVLYAHHHALLDGWSNFLLIRELVDLVRALDAGAPPALPEAPHSNVEYLAEERRSDAASEAHAERVRRRFSAAAFLPRPAATGAAATPLKRHNWASPSLVADLSRVAKAEGVSLRAVFLAAYARLLSETFGRDDLTVAAVCNGRSERMSEALDAVGFFWRYALVRCREVGTAAAFAEAHEALSDAQANSAWPYERELAALGVSEDEVLLPGFNYIRFRHVRDIDGVDSAQLIRKYDQYHFPLYLIAAVDPRNDSAHLILYADAPGIDEAELGRLGARYSALLEEIAREHRGAEAAPAEVTAAPRRYDDPEALPGARIGSPTPLVLRDGTRTWVRRWGGAHEDVLLGLHGITTNSLWFTPLAEALAARGCCQVMAFDRRGAGVNESGRRGDIPVGYHDVVDEIIEVARALSSEGSRIHLGAWCGTASLGALAAERAPGLFSSIVYLAPMFEESVTDAAMERLLLFRDRAIEAGSALDVLHPYPFEGLTPLPGGFDALMDPSVRFYEVTPRLMLAYAASLGPGEAAARSLSIPQCAFFGADDMLTDPIKGARRVRAWLPAERVHTFPGPHHLWFVSAPEVAGRIDAFLREVRSTHDPASSWGPR